MLPVFITSDRNFIQMQNQWSSQLNPIIANPLNNGLLLQNVVLAIGANSINHTLSRPLLGWFLTRKSALGDIYDTQLTNPYPQLTLNLVSSAVMVADVYVF